MDEHADELPLIGSERDPKLFKQVPPIRQFIKVRANYPWERASIDLMDMSKISKYNRGVSYLFIYVDVFSRFLYTSEMWGKDTKSIIRAFKDVFRQGAPVAPLMWIDRESGARSEECTKFLANLGSKIYHTYGDTHSVMAECAIKKLKKICFMYMYTNDTNEWTPCIERAVNIINNKVIRTTGLTPTQMLKPENKEYVLKTFEPEIPEFTRKEKEHISELELGDQVYIRRTKGVFERFYDPNWTEEKFTIWFMKERNGIPMYYLRDKKEEQIDGAFYANELLKA